MCVRLNGAWTQLYVYEELFLSRAMRAHTTVDSGVEWSLRQGGHEVREGGGENR